MFLRNEIAHLYLVIGNERALRPSSGYETTCLSLTSKCARATWLHLLAPVHTQTKPSLLLLLLLILLLVLLLFLFLLLLLVLLLFYYNYGQYYYTHNNIKIISIIALLLKEEPAVK